MTTRPATAQLIVDYLDRVEERPIARIVRHMHAEYGVSPSATKTAVWRLAKAGRIVRLEQGRYGRSRPGPK